MKVDLSDKDLVAKANWVRRETLLLHKLAPETRVASSLSIVEMFTALYYGNLLDHDPAQPRWEGRDRLVISKGHGSLCMYPILADRGYFPKSELEKICQKGSFLGGIPDPVIPGYETVNGSLGHGAGVGSGMAVGLKRKKSNNMVYVALGDGELYEGANWEAFWFAGHHGLDNLVFCIDENRTAMLNFTRNILEQSPLDGKLSAFGLDVLKVDGHDVVACRNTLREATARKNGKAKAILFSTIKGKGAPTLEGNPMAHVTAVAAAEVDRIVAQMDGKP